MRVLAPNGTSSAVSRYNLDEVAFFAVEHRPDEPLLEFPNVRGRVAESVARQTLGAHITPVYDVSLLVVPKSDAEHVRGCLSGHPRVFAVAELGRHAARRLALVPV